MTKGIEVIWRDDEGKVDEIEYFSGIDVDDLDNLPALSSVRAWWPRYRGGISVEYNVDVRSECGEEGTTHFIVSYSAADNPHLVDRDFGVGWGTNKIVLTPGSREGLCRWLRTDAVQSTKVQWRAFDVGETCGRPRATYLRSRRYSQFRSMVLDCDQHRCVLTGEKTERALEAAHLVPAKNGENDVPFNGITLRADLHRLFDTGFFTFGLAGEVVVVDLGSGLSEEYRQLLVNARLPAATLARVQEVLALPQFRER